MTLDEIITELGLVRLTDVSLDDQEKPEYGYTSDLLSCVMTGASKGSLWVTLQCHINIVAVATLLDLAAVIITEGALPDETTINKANQEGVVLLSTSKRSFEIVGRLWELGLRSAD